DETGVYKNLLQEIAQRVGSPLPQYTTLRSGLGHLPVFRGTVELAGIIFSGEPAKSKKQAEKNAALAAWLSLKLLAQQEASSPSEHENNEEQEQIRIARALQNYRLKEKLVRPNASFQNKFLMVFPTPPTTTPTSKILPFFSHRSRPPSPQIQRFTAVIRQCSPTPYQGGIAPPVTIRTAVPVFSAPPPVRIRQAIPAFAAPSPSKKAPPTEEE
ncbi:dsRNA-binding protein 2, partial [Perilla frutescens var. frutescens]